jgi:hypothetical protein
MGIQLLKKKLTLSTIGGNSQVSYQQRHPVAGCFLCYIYMIIA